MAGNQQANFWDFVNSFDPSHNGQGVDHQGPPGFTPFTAGGFPPFFPFGGPPSRSTRQPGAWACHGAAAGNGPEHGPNPWNGGGAPSRPRDGPAPRQPPSATVSPDEDVPDPAEVTPNESEEESSPRGHQHHGGGHGGRRGRGGPRHGRHHHHHHQRGDRGNPAFDFASMMGNLEPSLQRLFEQFVQPSNGNNGNNDSNNTNTRDQSSGNNNTKDSDIETFSPPLDHFSTPTAHVLHIALPGAKKEDVGVNWDPDTTTLHIAGVVHRAGDEEFLKTLQGRGERTVGMFKRNVVLRKEDGEVDAQGIGAKLEDGVLVVTVPKIEKGWTEIRKVDIE